MQLKSPIQELERYNNNRIFMKREDLLPFSFGGNKIRIALEYFADMEDQHLDTIISYGSVQSNLNRAIANLAVAKNKKCYIVSPKSSEVEQSFNRVLCQQFQAQIIETPKAEVAKTIKQLLADLKAQHRKPYYIYGNPLGTGRKNIPTRAYQKVYQEICEQEAALAISFDKIFLAVGTGSTLAGLIIGGQFAKGVKELIGFSIARNKTICKQSIEDFFAANLKSENDQRWTVSDEFLFGGYGVLHPEIIKSNLKVMQKFGIPLDNTYTGKAFYGMKQYILQHQLEQQNILFIHTGGTPLFFDYLVKLSNP